MPTPFIMPKFDMDQESATVVEWLKKAGDFVEIDEPVLLVETDKVAIDVPAPASGHLAGISVTSGDVVPVTTIIAYILAEGESAADLPLAPAADREIDDDRRPLSARQGGAIRATPVAERMASQLGIDLARVPVRQKRITKSDVEEYLAGQETVVDRPQPGSGRVPIPATPAARRLARELSVDLARLSGRGPLGRVQAADVESFAAADLVRQMEPGAGRVPRPAKRVPLSGKRRTIAERMSASFQTAPHIDLSVEVDAGRLEEARQRLTYLAQPRELASVRHPPKITTTALLVKIVAQALRRHPFINASLVGEEILLWQEVNIGVAVAIEEGLVVPVIHGADALTAAEISSRLHDLANKAQTGRLELADVRGGTFTLSNLGMFGVRSFRAIINPPESAILAIGQIVRKPVVVSNQDEIAVRPVMNLTLSADHRVIDGVIAARFLSDLVHSIEAPNFLI